MNRIFFNRFVKNEKAEQMVNTVRKEVLLNKDNVLNKAYDVEDCILSEEERKQ